MNFFNTRMATRCRYLVYAILAVVLAGCEDAGKAASNACDKVGDPRPVQLGDQWLSGGKGSFNFSVWSGPDIAVWTYIPSGAEAARLPIAIVMHGTGRDGDRYRDEWATVAEENQFIALVPEFPKHDFCGAEGYNLGNVFNRQDSQRRDEALWSFSAIEPLFSHAVHLLGSNQTHYTLYGHSAGSQFVHRFLYYKPEARVKRFIPANAGWYTLPDFEEPYPYGLLGAGVDEAALKAALQKDVTVLLGDRDIDAAHSSLRRTPEAMRQGVNRFERGQLFFERAKAKADELEVRFGWHLGVVPGAEHSNGQMAVAAAQLVD